MSRNRTEPSPNRGFLWLGVALLLALFLWAILRSGLFSTTALQPERADPNALSRATPAAVTAYVEYVEDRAHADGGASHAYSAEGFRHLARALETVAGDVDVETGVREIRERADSMQQDSAATTHARQAREAALIAASLLASIQDVSKPDVAERVRQVNEAARAITSEEGLLDQRDRVEAFFQESARVIAAMHRSV